MNKLKRGFSRVPRKVRIVIDLFLILILLGVYYIALGSPLSGEEARFRRAEKAYLVGPSEILETINVSSAWTQPAYDYNRMIIGDDGDEILFYTFKVGKGTSSMDGVITRRQKTDGILLTPIPMDTAYAIQRMEDELFQSLPLSRCRRHSVRSPRRTGQVSGYRLHSRLRPSYSRPVRVRQGPQQKSLFSFCSFFG